MCAKFNSRTVSTFNFYVNTQIFPYDYLRSMTWSLSTGQFCTNHPAVCKREVRLNFADFVDALASCSYCQTFCSARNYRRKACGADGLDYSSNSVLLSFPFNSFSIIFFPFCALFDFYFSGIHFLSLSFSTLFAAIFFSFHIVVSIAIKEYE